MITHKRLSHIKGIELFNNQLNHDNQYLYMNKNHLNQLLLNLDIIVGPLQVILHNNVTDLAPSAKILESEHDDLASQLIVQSIALSPVTTI